MKLMEEVHSKGRSNILRDMADRARYVRHKLWVFLFRKKTANMHANTTRTCMHTRYIHGSKSVKLSQSVTHMSKNKTRYLLIKPMFYKSVPISHIAKMTMIRSSLSSQFFLITMLLYPSTFSMFISKLE